MRGEWRGKGESTGYACRIFFFFFGRILIPQRGTELRYPVSVKVRNPNHYAAKGFLSFFF